MQSIRRVRITRSSSPNAPRVVVGRAERSDAALVALALEPVEVLSPRDEVVDLLDVYEAP